MAEFPLNQLKLHDYFNLVAGVILCYDWLLTLDMEVQFAWRAPKTSGVWLFLVNRYFTLLVYISVCASNFTPFTSVDSCQHYSFYRELALVFTVVIIAVILVLRTYALYQCDRRVLAFMVLVTMVLLSLGCWAVTGPKSDVSISRGCHQGPSQAIGTRTATAWEALFAFDTMIFLLTLIKTLKARENYPIGMNELSEIIFRDGAIYYGVMACANAINTVTFYVFPPMLKGTLSTFASHISVTMMSRAMLNIRQQTRNYGQNPFVMSSTLASLNFVPRDSHTSTNSDEDTATIQLDTRAERRNQC